MSAVSDRRGRRLGGGADGAIGPGSYHSGRWRWWVEEGGEERERERGKGVGQGGRKKEMLRERDRENKKE